MNALREALARFPRLDLAGGPTPLNKLDRLSAQLSRDLYVKRDDTTPLALGGNKVRKLEFLATDTLVTTGAIQSNHVRQSAAVAAKLGLRSVALLENPIGTDNRNYLSNGNRLLLDPVYTGKAMAGLLNGVRRKRFVKPGAILFLHTEGSPALFAYHPAT